jgi:hypothetical protein
MDRKTKTGILVKDLQERPVTAQVGISQHLGKIADRLVCMNAEKQGDGSGHRVLLERKLSHSLAPLRAAQAGAGQVKCIRLHYVAWKTNSTFLVEMPLSGLRRQ